MGLWFGKLVRITAGADYNFQFTFPVRTPASARRTPASARRTPDAGFGSRACMKLRKSQALAAGHA